MFLSRLIGFYLLLAGLALVLSRNVWSGGALPVVVTLAGWLALSKGVLILFLTPEAGSAIFLDALRYARLFRFYAGVVFVPGAYMTIASLRKTAE